MGEEYSRSIAIAGNTTASEGTYYLQYRCQHSFVDIELVTGGKIGDLCKICDQVSIKPEWIYYGRVVQSYEPIKLRTTIGDSKKWLIEQLNARVRSVIAWRE